MPAKFCRNWLNAMRYFESRLDGMVTPEVSVRIMEELRNDKYGPWLGVRRPSVIPINSETPPWVRIYFGKSVWKFDKMTGKLDGSLIRYNWRNGLCGDLFNNSHHARLKQGAPKWARDDEKVNKILLQAFPKKESNPTQAQRAARWRQIIKLYWVENLTQLLVAHELKMTVDAVHSVIRNIKRAAKGRQSGTRRKRVGRMGRPKKKVVPRARYIHKE